MPNIKSAKKELRKSRKRRLANRSKRSALRTYIKKARNAADLENREEANEALRIAYKKLDQAAAKKLIHKNTASRLKSRLAAAHKKGAEAVKNG